MRFLFKRIFLNFYFALQVFAVSMVLLCGSFSYAETDVLKDFKNYAKEDIPLKVEKVKNSVVQLYIKDEIGTGFILEDGILATNSHAVENILNKNNFFSKIDSDPLSEIEILQEDRLLDVQITSIQALDPVHDLALLNIKGDIPPAIKKPRRKVDLTKEKLFFVGYPNGKLKAMGQKGTIEILESKNHAEIYMPVFTSDIGGAIGSP
ncbi:MAG: S1 family peptidase, partial [Bdellovibrionales bacterium]